MLIKTSELKEKALDWAVAIANNMKPIIHKIQCGSPGTPFKYKGYVAIPCSNGDCWTYEPTLKHELSGRIMDANFISTVWAPGLEEHEWRAETPTDMNDQSETGPTRVIAALRCFVASKLGAEVEIPDELVE